MNDNDQMYRTYVPTFRTVGGKAFLIAIVVLALGIGLALVSPAFGAGLDQSTGGDIGGMVTVNGQGAAGILVELRQRSNGGADVALASTKTDASGAYYFSGQPSAPNDAFYYVHFTGAKGTLAGWYTFPIIYLNGSAFSVPGVEFGDVKLVEPAQGATVGNGATLRWEARKSGETYRVFIYADGKADKIVLDSGSLGMGTQFAIPDGSLPEGKYEAVVQVRDAVVGYGQSQARFHFTVGRAGDAGQGASPAINPAQGSTNPSTNPQPAQATPDAAPAPTTSQPQEAAPQKPDVRVNLSANKSAVGKGDNIIYKIEVSNKGDGAAAGVVVKDTLPPGVTVDQSRANSTAGSVSVEGNVVTAQVGDLPPNSGATVEIPVSVVQNAGGSLSNQASAQYTGANSPVQSNAYIAQVAAPEEGPAPSQPQQPATNPPANPPANPQAARPSGPAANPLANSPSNSPAAKPQTQPASPPKQQPSANPHKPATGAQAKPPANVAKQPSAAVPQTGGAFPVVLALVLVMFTLLARYLRGRGYRRV